MGNAKKALIHTVGQVGGSFAGAMLGGALAPSSAPSSGNTPSTVTVALGAATDIPVAVRVASIAGGVGGVYVAGRLFGAPVSIGKAVVLVAAAQVGAFAGVMAGGAVGSLVGGGVGAGTVIGAAVGSVAGGFGAMTLAERF